MKYKQLLETLCNLSDDELQQDVTILDNNQDEFYPVESISISSGLDVLDDGQIYLIF